MKKFIVQMIAGLGLAAGAVAAPPNVTGVTLSNSVNRGIAEVRYVIDGPGIATFQFKTNGVDVCHREIIRTVSGDINTCLPAAGAYRFTWNGWRDIPPQLINGLTVEITLWETNSPPTFCAVSLTNSPAQVLWYGKESEMPCVVNNSRWKTDWLLLRKIPASEGRFVTLGAPPGEPSRDNTREIQRNVRITKPFYMGVFPVTQKQWHHVYGTWPSTFSNTAARDERPVEEVSFEHIRGTAAAGYNWPVHGHAVATSSFMGLLRARTGGMIQFDLPTEAQWEYACRAGTTGSLNNGTSYAANPDPNLNLLGRYLRNGGHVLIPPNTYTNPVPYGVAATCTDEVGTAKVGSYLPNAWDLYDMHGNVWEICLDLFASRGDDPTMAGDDPVGPTAGSTRMCRGGSWNYSAADCRSARRGTRSTSSPGNEWGLRIAAPAEVLAVPPAVAPAPLGAAPQTLLISHRGESMDYPENTMAAYRAAVERGADGLELDIYLTKDNEIICLHDSTALRTGGLDVRPRDATLAELKALDVGAWKGPQFAGERIPTLAEALTLARDNFDIHVEIKTGAEIVPYLVQVIAAEPKATPGRVVFTGFSEAVIKAVRQQLPAYRTYWFTGTSAGTTPEPLIAKARACDAFGVAPGDLPAVIKPAFIKAIKDAGFSVNVWTVNSEPRVRELVEMGADVVLSDCAAKYKRR